MPVSNPTDKAEENALPDPELNPLLNPLLAAHMGRWAEVYFTTPPDRREQAVADLLKELEAGSPAQFDSHLVDNAATGEINTHRDSEREQPLDWPPEPVNIEAICSACGHQNSEGYRFCGMCGAPVHIWPDARIAEIERPDPIEPASWAKPSRDANPVDYAIAPDYRFPAVRQHDDTDEPAWPLANHVPYGANDVPHFAAEPKPVPYRYRLYVGVGLAILLAVLVYMARRGTEALSGAGQSPPSRIIPAAQPGPTTSEPPPATGSVTPVEKVQKAEKKQNVPKRPAQSAKLPEASSPKQTTAALPAPRMVPVAANSTSLSLEQSGAQDLATAEGYLHGNQGTTRDSREAAQWLWKAVGKGNPAATIVLSDLYLRGDGVPKSCDQARLLLDAASRKGVKAAADRLRDLQAFGCQ
jgi:hypothetical protein